MSHKYHIINSNILDWSSDELFDGVLCDPPYELGFMGKSWDSSGIAYDVEMWRNIFDHLKPGAHLLAFSGSRTYHRMACAIEDAGFEIRDMIEWVYGSGFPKSLNIGKAVDKIQGKEVTTTYEPNFKNGTFGKGLGGGVTDNTPADNEYNGYGTALKPAHEPCVLARKPIEGTVANNVLKHGTGGLNIDQCRVPTQEDQRRPSKGGNNGLVGSNTFKIRERKVEEQTQHTGRFPANLIHDGSDEVIGLFPNTKGDTRTSKPTYSSGMFKSPSTISNALYSDSGSAARFFYTAKASKSERNAGLEGFEDRPRPTMGSGIGGQPDQQRANNKNVHPTVKPLSLTKYLATLIKPPTGGRLLVPFSGSGSEMIGALQAGWDYVEGIELEKEYIAIAEARIRYWLGKPIQDKLL